jgi:lactate dehydrogenase-like 2-hydroxyacid dehydrogenase
MTMKPSNVFVTRRIPEAGTLLLRRKIGRFEMNPDSRPLPRKELLRALRGRKGVLCLLTDRMDAEAMDAAGPDLRVISNFAVGYDNIDVAEATRRKILVTNTPGVLTEATAEMAWALLFAAARRIPESDRFTRAGKFQWWDPLLLLGHGVTGKTLGVVGAGRIGSAFAMMSSGFRMNVLYHSRSRKPHLEKKLGARPAGLKTLLKESDFVSLHLNLSPETRHLIGREELSMMKPTAILVNTSRGPVIDEKALVWALKNKKIAAAGLDVYEQEPELAPGLAGLENAVLAPHTASATLETRSRMAELAADNLAEALLGRLPKHPLNPEAFRA